MPKLSLLKQKLLDKHPDLTKKEINTIASMIISARSTKLRGAYILDFKLPLVGRFRTHRAKKTRRYNKNKAKDRKRKKEQQELKKLTKESLLF